MVRRMKSELKDNGVPVFKSRQLIPVEVPYTAVEKTIHQKLRQYADSRTKNAVDAAANAPPLNLSSSCSRSVSLPIAFYDTLQKHQQTLAGKSDMWPSRPDGPKAAFYAAKFRRWKKTPTTMKPWKKN